MRTHLVYPKIPGCEEFWPAKCIAFEKYDGTNLHWVWNKDKGFYAFGTRRDRYDLNEEGIAQFKEEHPGLEEAPDLFIASYKHLGDEGGPIQREYGPRSERADSSGDVIVFTEFLGEKSFAGSHVADDPKRLVLIDVKTDWGFIGPDELCKDFQNIEKEGYHFPRILYSGKYIGQLAVDIREGRYNVNEGAVIKGVAHGIVYMSKVKTNAYGRRLKEEFKDEWRNYWE